MRLHAILLPALFLLAVLPLYAQVFPDMPQEWLAGCLPQTEQYLTVCASGCDYTNNQLQLAIDQAPPGTTILLEPDVTYTGPFNLPEKSGEGWILLRTNLPDDQLPPLNTRMDPSYAPLLARLEAKPGPTLPADLL